MRVYSRAMEGTSWSSVEDYLSAGNALGYNQNWQYRHTGGELLMMGAAGELSGYYPSDAAWLHTQSVPQVCACLVQPQTVAACAPLEICGATCEITLAGNSGHSDILYLNLNGVGGLPQYGLTTNAHYLPLLLPGLIGYLVRACLQGIGGSALGNLVEWITCVIGALIRGYPLREAVDACGGLPVNGCELLAGCIGGILGGPLGKWIPKLKDIAEELVGWVTSGLCRGLTLPPPPRPNPCPEPRPSPLPRQPAPGGGGSGLRIGPLPAV
ncbi:hypothetical protein HRbin15_01499 [bacterium HR15]|nr:hypothetical protein HRbin15_01499 [bacterium HR15]